MADLDAFEDYLEEIDEEDLEYLVAAISDTMTLALRFGVELMDYEYVAVGVMDDLIDYGPRTDKAMVLFKQYEGEELRKGGTLEDAAYTTGTTKDLPGGSLEGNGGVTLAIQVPKGSKAFYLGEDTWILPRGIKLALSPSSSGVMSAKIV